jgi:hypothetical protein
VAELIGMKQLPHDPSPWWRHRMMWLVVGGPLLVVIAAVATAVIAVRGADTVLQVTAVQPAGASAPAMQARNHAATPAEVKP